MRILLEEPSGLRVMVMGLSDPTAFEPFNEWEKVRTEIILKLLDPNKVNMVGCHRHGRDMKGPDNFSTVVVVVDP